jgi:tetratricopeptide (TPR) repeat protein
LEPGRYWMTSSAEYLSPLMQELTAVGGTESIAMLPATPVTTENYPEVASWVMREILGDGEHSQNPHLLIIALHLTTDPTDAESLLERTARELPGDPMVELLRAKSLIRQNRLDEALESVEKGLRKFPDLAFAWRTRAEALRRSGSLREALESANQAVALEPFGWRNQRIRAAIHQQMGNVRSANADNARAEELYRMLHEQRRRRSQQ